MPASTRLREMGRRQAAPALALLLYLGLSLWTYAPGLSSLETALIGSSQGDVFRNSWGHWWTGTMLLDHFSLPAFTTLVNFPYGQLIMTIDPLNCLASVPLQLLFGFPGGYNAFLVCATAFSALGAFLLARDLTGSAAAALPAGAIYGFAPFALSASLAGNSEVANVGWIPLFYLFLHRALRSGAARDGCLAGTFLACTTLANWYYGYIAALFAVPIVAAGLLSRERPPLRNQVRSLEWMLLVFGLFTLAMLLVYGGILQNVSRSIAVGRPFRETLVNNSVDLANLVAPAKDRLALLSLFQLPIPAWLLAAAGVVLAPRRAALPAALGLGALLLAMGYRPQASADLPASLHALAGGLSVVAGGLYDAFLDLPMASMLRFPGRFMVLVNLAVAVLAALGLARVLRSLPSPTALGIGALVALPLVHLALGSSHYHELFATTPVPMTESVRLMREDPVPGFVLHLPMDMGGGRQLFDQSAHHRPLLSSIDLVTSKIHRSPRGRFSIHLTISLHELNMRGYDLAHRRWPEKRSTPYPRASVVHEDLEQLRAMGMRYVVLHRELFRPEDQEYFDREIAPRLEFVRREGTSELFRVER